MCDDVMTTHNNSIANLIRGVGERVLFTDRQLTPCIKPLVGIFSKRCASFSREVARCVGRQSPVSRQSFVDYYKGRRRTIYQQAADGLVLKPIRPRDAYLSTFVKAEKINLSNKPDPAPRVIQPRNPRYNVELGRFLLPLEHKVYDAIDEVFGSPTIMSKYNSVDQAAVLREKWDKFREPVCVGLDASRFDQHVSEQALKFEHDFYRMVFGSRKDLSMLLSWQLTNKGFARATDGSFSYIRKGSRMSGDMNTSLGNKFLMCAMGKTYLDQLQIKYEFANNGDDCLVFIERSNLKKLSGLQTYFRGFGFKIVTEKPVFEFEHVEFCQCRPLFCNNIWRMVRNVKTCLLKDVTSVNLGHDVTQYRAWLADIAGCGLSFAADVPILGAYYRMLQRFGQAGRYHGDDSMFNCYRTLSKNSRISSTVPDALGRYSFWLQTGIHPDGQQAIENYFEEAIWGGDKRQLINNIHYILKNGS